MTSLKNDDIDAQTNMESTFTTARGGSRKLIGFKNFKQLKFNDDISSVYEPGHLLGTGTFGEVLECRHRQTGMKVAVKIVQRTRIE